MPSPHNDISCKDKEFASSVALLRTLDFAKVQFLRYVALDVCGNVRCKTIPIDQLRKHPEKLFKGIALVKVCIAGLPSYGDVMVSNSGLTAAGTAYLIPALETLRILPYQPSSAMVLGDLTDPTTHGFSDLCCRHLLFEVVEGAKDKYNLGFTIGVEIEFVLFDSNNNPVDHTNFADTTILNQSFVPKLYENLASLEISVELIHSESAHGQLEVVLEFLPDPVQMMDHTVLAKETIRATANTLNLKAIFLPKVDPMLAGNGCHFHVGMVDAMTGQSKFVDQDAKHTLGPGAVNMSSEAKSFVEGILRNLPGLQALTMPTDNSFRRVGPGCWTGSEACWDFDDKEAPLRVVDGHVEYKLCDFTANPYLALAGILITGLDGIALSSDLRPPKHEEKDGSLTLPNSITESLRELEANTILQSQIPKELMTGYLAVRRAEAKRALSLREEVGEAVLHSTSL